MKFDKLLICLAIFAFSVSTVVCGDPLNPGMLGETMDMPLPPDLVQKAVAAGVIKSASEVTGPLPSGGSIVNLGTPTASDLAASQDGASDATVGAGAAGPVKAGLVNAGPIASQGTDSESSLSSLKEMLSLVLQDSVTRYLTLAITQKDDMIIGRGNMTSGSSVQDVTASGLVTGGQISLTVTPADSSDLYKLKLLPDGNTLKGSYDAQSADGTTWSGTAAGILPGDLLKISVPETSASKTSASEALEPLNPGVAVGGAGASSSTAARAGPVQLDQSMGGGSSFSSSKSISMSTSSGGSMVSSTSSTSF